MFGSLESLKFCRLIALLSYEKFWDESKFVKIQLNTMSMVLDYYPMIGSLYLPT